MNKKDRITLYPWSKRLASLRPFHRQPNGEISYLPRLVQNKLPRFVRACPTTMSTIAWLRLLNWEKLPPSSTRQWFNQQPIPTATYIAAYLIKLEHKLSSMGHLRRFLVAHPALIWALGFPLVGHGEGLMPGFDPEASLPTRRHFSRVMREMDNSVLQILLDGQAARLQTLFPVEFAQIISLDTKHILAWVKENNPKAYIKEGRLDKKKQPMGDLDCKLGCKRRHNRRLSPTKEGQPADGLSISIGEFYWGYASGAVVTKVPDWGEFVLAEVTQTFDKGDTRYFFPLMEQTERRLGFKPRYGTLDAAFDAFYVYDYFHNHTHNGFAAVPLNQIKGQERHFDEDGLPLCAAGLPMPIRKTYTDRTKAIIVHQRAFHACPLLYPTATGQECPVNHEQWPKGGCSAQMPVAIGARIRYQIDRDGELYKAIYAQRTAVERIFSQAVNLGIERPKLRSQQAIANHNTLIYLLINVKAIQRVLIKREAQNR